MAIARQTRVRPQDFVEEIKAAILRTFPDAKFEVQRRKTDEYILHVIADFDDEAPDASELTSERRMDILEDHDVWIIVLSHDRKQLEALGLS